MNPEEHQQIMKETMDYHLAKMSEGGEAILLSIDREGKNLSVISTLDDGETCFFMKQAVAVKEGVN